MSIWQRGTNEVTEETQTLRNKLSSKESQIAAQQNEILKQAAELAELKSTLNETLHKLNHEAARAVSLESTLAKSTEDLRNERLAVENVNAALAGAHEKLKAKDLETRELEATLESLSHKSNSFNARGTKLEKEKSTLEARVRELEGNLRQLSSPAPTAATTTPSRHRAARRRSSSVSDTRITTLEQDVKDTRASLTQVEAELRGTAAKLSQAQNDLVQVENEKLASEKRLHTEIRDLRAALREKDEDMKYMKEQLGDGGREEELLKRIDEDEAKIATLELLLSDGTETKALKEHIRRLDQKLLIESERMMEMEDRHAELVREKEDALDEAENAQAQLATLQKEAALSLQRQLDNANDPRLSVEDTERLLQAIERIRGERDNLRGHLQFMQTEAKFAQDALEARIATLTNENSPSPTTVDPELQAEVHLLRQQLTDAEEHQKHLLHKKNQEIRRIGIAAMASAVVIEHLQSQAVAEQPFNPSSAPQDVIDTCQRLKDVQEHLGVAAQDLDAMTRQRDELLAQLAMKESEWAGELGRARAAHQDAQDELVQFDARINDLSRSLYDVEVERDYLNLQVTNLSRDLEAAQREVAEAETRYSELQFHQLNSMTSNEATHALRAQLADQEARVMRRTELVGILQHETKRLETNLKLQEERLNEMTAELEVMAAEKDAMVEDCADARQARDAAIARVEDLEVELETLEGRAEQGDSALCAVVGVVIESVNRSRRALRQLSSRPVEPVAESIDWPAQIAELDNQRQELQALVSDMEATHQAEVQRLADQLTEKDRLMSATDLEGELARLKVKHVEEMGLLQGQLVETASARDEAQARCEAAEEHYRQALSDSTRSKQELESAAGDAVKQAEGLRTELARIRSEHAVAVERLETRVASVISEAEKVRAAHRELESLHQTTMDELAQAGDAAGVRLHELEDRVAELDSQLEAQTARCDALSEEVDALQRQLEQESEARSQEKQDLEATLVNAREECERAESSAAQLKQELSDVAAELAEAGAEVESLHNERTALQAEVTTMQAEIQRSLSLRRYLENQVKERQVDEQLVASLTSDLEQAKAQYARAEKAGKAAEVNLSLQNAQHRREMAEVQKQLAALQSRPDLSSALADLEERNNEMEELLKNKCAEIEENDDRTLEMLKNNKKLTTKVESLTRKVQNLQAKLAAAKASQPGAPVEAAEPEPKASPSFPNPPPSLRQRSNTLAAIPTVPSLPSFVPPSPSRTNRVASEPQTPETRTIPFPPSPSVPVLGQKRRAPDDFEDVPTQGFTPDCIPDENGTPRVRRVLNSLHSGFTPVRNSITRAPAAASPKRASKSSSPYIADVTNSPRLGDTAKAKRTWLGKIRGTSQPRAPPRL
ncbi:Wd40 containing snare-dependent exocytosis protein [Mycena sanguinolenta]|uniref:Wd40 containing snare-dependent exocytosis protein n=1 Tax=Mycena sanguinolenta TaxID=230812 RepID=A0A8H6XBB2_9AGAR|nr:Wd40 containing snare-dependent exocytosis protein [Mycena sanguinolenta]